MNTLSTIVKIKTIHFIGIGGSGMCGIAEILIKKGYNITGSDQYFNANIKRLISLGAKVFIGHDASQIIGADIIVISSAIEKNNPEIVLAHSMKIPVLTRAQMLAELIRFHHSIAIAGTHGKTTTTSLITSILIEAKLNPNFIIGGILNKQSISANLGDSKYFIIEADESDASFLLLNPMIGIITNIDIDHMQTYSNDFNKLKQTFINFVNSFPFYGIVIVCIDDQNIRDILPFISRKIITYGLSNDADIQIRNFQQNELKSKYNIYWKNSNKFLEIDLNLPGIHNALNATAAVIIAKECCHVNNKFIKAALMKFKGVERRIQFYGEINTLCGQIILIDDYGHHPTEIYLTIEALKNAWPNRRLVLVFQPHRYTRTKELFSDFIKVLSLVDLLVLTEIYAANEPPIPEINGIILAQEIKKYGKTKVIYVHNHENLLNECKKIIRDKDILLIQGAGSIGLLANNLRNEFLNDNK